MNSDRPPAPDESFALLSDDRRIGILEVLAAESIPQSFSELYEGADAPNTANLAYHLRQMMEVYVEKVDEGYLLTNAGHRALRFARSESIAADLEFDDLSVPTNCPRCGDVDGTVEDEVRLVSVRCGECGLQLIRTELTPAIAAERDSLEALEAADRRVRSTYADALTGTCGVCGGVVDRTLERLDEPVEGATYARTVCRRCGETISAPVELVMIHHPAVIAHYWRRGVDLDRKPTWELLREISQWETIDRSGSRVPVGANATGEGVEMSESRTPIEVIEISISGDPPLELGMSDESGVTVLGSDD